MRSLIPLSQEEWIEINRELPDVTLVVNRVMRWTRAEMISTDGFEKLNELRLSRVRFHYAVEKLRGARYALGESRGIRKYYFERMKKDRDENHVLGDWLSRLFADYVPLLLYSATEHSLDGLLDLYKLKEPPRNTADYRLKRIRICLEREKGGNAIANAIGLFDDSAIRAEAWNYRNKWVHHKPKRVESILYNPPYTSPPTEKLAEIEFSQLGYEVPVDYQWDEFVEMLKQGLSDTIRFIDDCTREWENVYSRHSSDLPPFLSNE